MDKRTKILAILLGGAVLYAAVAKIAYPRWIDPLLTFDERIAKRQKELDKLEAVKEQVVDASFAYKRYVERIGSFDIDKVVNTIRPQIDALIERHNLRGANVTPSRTSEIRKTSVEYKTITVQAEGPLQGVAGLMKDIAELPYLIHFGNVTISPGKSTLRGGRMTLHEQVKVRLPFDLWVLPPNRTAGPIAEAALANAEVEPVIRHKERDYSSLWTGRPFSDFLRPQELRADAGKDQSLAKPGRSVALRGSAKGGIGEYTIQWSPSDGVQDPNALVTKVNTSQPGEFEYTLTVTDEAGGSHFDSVLVTIKEGKPSRPDTRVTRQPKEKDTRWGDRRYMQVVMMLGRTHKGTRLDEVMVFDRKIKGTNYYAPGDEFDGGQLVYVHQTGGLVHRKGEYFVYPMGGQLDQDLALADAAEYVALQRAAERHRAAAAREAEEKAAEEDAKSDAASDESAAGPSDGKPSSPEPGDTTAAAKAADEERTELTPEAASVAAKPPVSTPVTRTKAERGNAERESAAKRRTGKKPRPIGRKPR